MSERIFIKDFPETVRTEMVQRWQAGQTYASILGYVRDQGFPISYNGLAGWLRRQKMGPYRRLRRSLAHLETAPLPALESVRAPCTDCRADSTFTLARYTTKALGVALLCPPCLRARVEAVRRQRLGEAA